MNCGDLYGTVKAVQKTIETKIIKRYLRKSRPGMGGFLFCVHVPACIYVNIQSTACGKADKTGFILHFIYIMYII